MNTKDAPDNTDSQEKSSPETKQHHHFTTQKSEKLPGDSPEPSVWSIISPVQKEIATGMAISALSAIFWYCSIMLFWPITTELMADNPNTTKIWQLFGLSLALVAATLICRVLSFQVSHLGSYRLEQILRTELSTLLAKVPLGYVVNTGSGPLKKVLLEDVKMLHTFVADSTPLFAKAYTTPIVGAILLFIIDWRLALAGLAVFPVGVVAMMFAFKDYPAIRKRNDAANERMNSIIVEYIQGMQVVRTFDDGSSSFRRYRKALAESSAVLREWTGKSQVSAYTCRALFTATPTLSIVLVVSIILYNRGSLGLPELMMGLALAPTLSESILPIVWLQQLIENASAAVKRIHALRQVQPLPEAETPLEPADATLTFQDVYFRYAGREDYALAGVSFTAEPGKVTALVGPSGSGKSTAAQLMLRFWDPESGGISIGGVNLKNMTSDTLMQHVSFVFQSPFLLHDTVSANIALGKTDATEDEIQAAAKAAQAHDFIISELPRGYDTIVGERGSSLSGGQRQRLTIARAILQNAPIIVLDEATAFSDPDNEAKIHDALATLARGKTLLVVAHRLSTIQYADQIVVLDDGKVAEIGSHDQLRAIHNGIYANLWNNFERAQGWGLPASKNMASQEN